MKKTKKKNQAPVTPALDFMSVLVIFFLAIGALSSVLGPSAEFLTELEERVAAVLDPSEEPPALPALVQERERLELSLALKATQDEAEREAEKLALSRETKLTALSPIRSAASLFDRKTKEAVRLVNRLQQVGPVSTRLKKANQQIDDLKVDLTGLLEAKDSLTEIHTQLDLERAELEAAVQKLSTLKEEVDELRTSRKEKEERTKLALAEIEKIKAQLSDKDKEIAKAESVSAMDLAPVNPDEPRRRPLFVECDAEGVRLMPDGELLTSAAPPDAKKKLLSLGKSKGYVVFLIRPSGISSFRTYYKVLQEHNTSSRNLIDLGFEPIDSSWRVDYGS